MSKKSEPALTFREQADTIVSALRNPVNGWTDWHLSRAIELALQKAYLGGLQDTANPAPLTTLPPLAEFIFQVDKIMVALTLIVESPYYPGDRDLKMSFNKHLNELRAARIKLDKVAHDEKT